MKRHKFLFMKYWLLYFSLFSVSNKVITHVFKIKMPPFINLLFLGFALISIFFILKLILHILIKIFERKILKWHISVYKKVQEIINLEKRFSNEE